MDFWRFARYTLTIGKTPPGDFEAVVGLGGGAAQVAVYAANVLPLLLGTLVGLWTLPAWGPGFRALGPLPRILVLLALLVPLGLLRIAAFWLLRRWVKGA